MEKITILTTLSLLFLAAPVAADGGTDTGTHTCTVALGLGTPVVSPSLVTSVGNLGGCQLHGAVESTVVVTDLSPADGCTIHLDENGDGVSDGQVTQDNVTAATQYPAGTSFSAFCELGVQDAVNSITLGLPAGR